MVSWTTVYGVIVDSWTQRQLKQQNVNPQLPVGDFGVSPSSACTSAPNCLIRPRPTDTSTDTSTSRPGRPKRGVDSRKKEGEGLFATPSSTFPLSFSKLPFARAEGRGGDDLSFGLGFENTESDVAMALFLLLSASSCFSATSASLLMSSAAPDADARLLTFSLLRTGAPFFSSPSRILRTNSSEVMPFPSFEDDASFLSASLLSFSTLSK